MVAAARLWHQIIRCWTSQSLFIFNGKAPKSGLPKVFLKENKNWQFERCSAVVVKMIDISLILGEANYLTIITLSNIIQLVVLDIMLCSEHSVVSKGRNYDVRTIANFFVSNVGYFQTYRYLQYTISGVFSYSSFPAACTGVKILNFVQYSISAQFAPMGTHLRNSWSYMVTGI